MDIFETYELVIGLEIHAQLKTESKLFCGDSTAFGAPPNTHVSPITLAHPGTLPRINEKAISFAIKMGLACHCSIARYNYFARKNYFYPDLPKGYQVSQHTTPICAGGQVAIIVDGSEKIVRLNRIHLEEDAGKSIHDADPDFTCVDYNRAGTPLIEIVTEPDLRSADEAFAYVAEVRKLVRYLDICDGNMEEGSLRCDANVSVRKRGDIKLGTKVEVKNLNSIRNVKRAIEVEATRLVNILESGGTVVQETRSYDANNNSTFATREKEDADDYRYFPEPDLAPFQLEEDFIEDIRLSLPELQPERMLRYCNEFGLSEYDARVLTEERETADFFEAITSRTPARKAAANWLLGPIKSWLNETNQAITDFPVSPITIAALIDLVENGKLSFSIASTRVLPQLINEPGRLPEEIAVANNWIQQSDSSALLPVIEQVLAKYPEKVAEYKKGKRGLLSLFVGEVMKQSKGKADPKVTNELLLEKLKS